MAIAAGLLVIVSAWFLMFPRRLLVFGTISTILLPSSAAGSSFVRRPYDTNDDGDILGYNKRRKLADYNNNNNNNQHAIDHRGRGLDRCLEDKIFSERVEIGTKCVCKDNTDSENDNDRGIVLLCSDACAFCNNDRTICGIKSLEALYDAESGSKIGIGQVFEYLKLGQLEEYMAMDEEKKSTTAKTAKFTAWIRSGY